MNFMDDVRLNRRVCEKKIGVDVCVQGFRLQLLCANPYISSAKRPGWITFFPVQIFHSSYIS